MTQNLNCFDFHDKYLKLFVLTQKFRKEKSAKAHTLLDVDLQMNLYTLSRSIYILHYVVPQIFYIKGSSPGSTHQQLYSFDFMKTSERKYLQLNRNAVHRTGCYQYQKCPSAYILKNWGSSVLQVWWLWSTQILFQER